MKQIFLSYARKDGKVAASRLRSELQRVGFEVWHDIEDMQGGLAWKEQLRQAIRKVDVVLVLMSPAAVESRYVEWEWETAITVEKKVIPLLISVCEVPRELKDLHYHNLSTEQEYVLGFASLIRDLTQANIDVATNKQSAAIPQAVDPISHKQHLPSTGDGNNVISVAGNGNLVGNSNTITH